MPSSTSKVTGAANVGGDLMVSLQVRLAPAVDAHFTILTVGSTSGTPTSDFSAAPLASGLAWGVVFVPTTLGITVLSIAVLAGDYKNHGFVNAADNTSWLTTSAPRPARSPSTRPAGRSAQRSPPSGHRTTAPRQHSPHSVDGRTRTGERGDAGACRGKPRRPPIAEPRPSLARALRINGMLLAEKARPECQRCRRPLGRRNRIGLIDL